MIDEAAVHSTSDPQMQTTRLAPSPTGALHLGNARTFLINWALARQSGWRIVLRIEDLDGPRVKAGAAETTIDVLNWLGLDWDAGPVYQSDDARPYVQTLERLSQNGLIYPCTCTRREIELAQSAPHEEDREVRYPGTCRPGQVPRPESVIQSPAGWRVMVPDEPMSFVDVFHGAQRVNVQAQVGDFLVATKAGLPAYQLAVVVDDARQGVTQVVRGDDLLSSTARQLWLYRLLGLSPLPCYTHLPLVLGADSRRLAKRHGDTRLSRYREQGVAPERIIGLIASWSGFGDGRTSMSVGELVEGFRLDRLPRQPAVFTRDDDAWLNMM